ncbi:unnamed protein product [Prorocentrum cordatum]|uniref:peptidylprolyl isomerase n=1 Tax=Prorocentrum cordatum TaxID=2364126 RepID=A0ABN9Y3C4_9DINO|nr:unnamed protein product [Polarella glacialis]
MARSDDEMGAPSEAHAPAEARRKIASKRPPPGPPGPPGSSSGIEFIVCFLCQEGGTLSESWFGKPLHHQCKLAVRSRRRAVMGSAAALSDQADMHRDPEKWRATHLPYLEKDTRRAAIQELKTSQKQEESNMSVEKDLNGCEDVWLTKVRFRAFMGFWEGLSREEADERFDAEFDANPKYNRRNQQIVLAEGNEYVKHEAGTESKRGATPETLPQPARKKLKATESPETLGPHAKHLHAKKALQDAVKEIVKGFEGKATTYARLTKLAERHKGYADLPENLKDVVEKFASIQKQAKQLGLKAERAGPTGDGSVASCTTELDSMKVELTSCWADATELVQSLELIDKEMQTTKRKTYLQDRHQSQKVRVAGTLNASGAFDSQLAEHVAPLIAQTWAKAQATMVADEEGDYSAYCLQPVSSCGITMDATMNEFNPTKLFAWKTPFPSFQEMLVDIRGRIDERCNRLNEKMAANRDTWLGAQANVDSENEYGEHLKFLPGLGLHLCCIVRNALRLGAMAVPLPALGCFMSPLNESMFVLVYDVAEIINQGIVLKDIQTFLKSSSGEGFLKSKHAVCVYLPKNAVLFVPSGFYAQPLFYHPGPRNQKIDPNWLHYLHVPFLNAEIAKTVDPDVFKAATALSTVHLAPLQSSMWVERRKGFSDFVQQALKMPVEHLDRPCALLGIYTGHSSLRDSGPELQNFHLKLLPRLAQFPGRWLGDRLCASLVAVLAELEADFRARHPGAADACSAAVALVVGAQLAVCLAGRSACLLLGAGARAVPAAPPAGARRRALNEAAERNSDGAGCVGLGPAESCCLLLGASAAEAAAGRPEAAAACLALGARPRAACGQLLAAAGRRGEGGEGTAAAKEGMAAAAAFLSWRGAAAEDGAAAEPSRKRPRVQDKEASQVRVRHILVKHRDVKGALDKVRSRPVRRSQWEAEDLLRGALCDLAMVEGQPKKCSELFTQRCRELSECASALKGGEFAGDLGWLARGGKKAIEEAAFGLRVGQLSDLIVTESGVHLLYRSA